MFRPNSTIFLGSTSCTTMARVCKLSSRPQIWDVSTNSRRYESAVQAFLDTYTIDAEGLSWQSTRFVSRHSSGTDSSLMGSYQTAHGSGALSLAVLTASVVKWMGLISRLSLTVPGGTHRISNRLTSQKWPLAGGTMGGNATATLNIDTSRHRNRMTG